MKKCFILVALVFVMVVVGEVWGIRVASAAERIKLRMLMVSEPDSSLGAFGGLHAAAYKAEPIVCNVMEPLVDVGKNGEPVPKLAIKWEHSSDFTKWRFYLRKGVKFHNGADFTARDVVDFAKWNIELKMSSILYANMPFKEAVAVDDYTVDLIFETPQPLFLITARLFLIPPSAISRDNRAMYITNLMGTGPYRYVEWKRGQYIKLIKFEGYQGPKPQIDDVEINFRAEPGVRLAALMAGEVDWVYGLGVEQATKAAEVAKIVRLASPETVWIRFDEYIQKERLGRESPFADKRLRLAVEYAIDRKALLTLYGGFITPSLGQFASPGDFGFNPNLKNRPYDLEKAKALVREAGAVGKTVSMAACPEKYSKNMEVSEAIAYMIEQTGLKVKLISLPRVEGSKYIKTDGDNWQYMVDIQSWSTDSLLEVERSYAALFAKGGYQCALNDPETTRLYNEALAETDYAKRGKKLANAWAYIYEQAHYIPLFKQESLWGIGRNLEWKIDIAGRPFIADMRFIDKR